jgi:hypothetical protein
MPEPTRSTLTVYLLPTTRGRWRLVAPEIEAALAAEAEEPPPEDREESGGRDEATGEEAGRPGVLRRGLRWSLRRMRARGGATERVLRELRLPETVEVVHPAGLPTHAARRIYRERVEAAVRHHRRWLVVDGVLLPVSVLLSVVPGPNLLLPYLAWRTLAHWRGQSGASRALTGADLESTFVAEPTLDPLLDLAARRFVFHRKRRLREIGDRAGIPDLDRHL